MCVFKISFNEYQRQTDAVPISVVVDVSDLGIPYNRVLFDASRKLIRFFLHVNGFLRTHSWNLIFFETKINVY